MKLLGMAFLAVSVSGLVFAGVGPSVPEMDAGTAASALAMLTGAVLVIRGRRKK